MASAMYDLIHENNLSRKSTETAELEVTGWDPKTMHIWCFFHKIALIVNAGLKALSLETLPPEKTKESVLGFFPVLGRLVEEEEPDQTPKLAKLVQKTTLHVEDYDAASESDYGNADEEVQGGAGQAYSNEDSEKDKLAAPPEKHACTTRLQDLTKKLDVYQSYQKAIDAREVIDHILKEDQQQNQAGGLFDNALFSPRNWKEIDNLNAKLEVFVKLTSHMEGNSATGAHVILKYLELKESLTEKLKQSLDTSSLYPMYHAMLKQVNKYLCEAMECETLLLATMMNPCFRCSLFKLVFGAESLEVNASCELLMQEFRQTKDNQTKLDDMKTTIDPDVVAIEKPPN
ncbi:hypothetical protein PCANC_05865 [Puccinia coronata f. sp. avenae]|uniref:hAT-like transposase RNase-H fold domain-containing protein n=1 Tax=Puccinia coronata f. sp. avenae TaxID=200324 RepID=A0A2N5VBT5_9BASI|nr:hypothetical protein PCANC_05865 [Puccinia coronata f. sp. avenae]